MRRFFSGPAATLMGVALLVGCSSDGGAADETTTVPTVGTATTVPEVSAEALDATFELTFDGNECVAEGPSEVPPGEITVLLINESDLLVAGVVRRLDDGYTFQDVVEQLPPAGEWKERPSWIHDVPRIGSGLPEGVKLPPGDAITVWQVGVTTDPGQHEIHLGIINEGIWPCTGFVVTGA